MYGFDHDPAANVLRITAQGFWDMPTVGAFGAAAVARGTAIRLRHGRFAILNDVRGFAVQSGTVATAINLLLGRARLLTDGPIATLCDSMLVKLQVDRILPGERIRSFLDEGEAMDWLAAEWPQLRAA